MNASDNTGLGLFDDTASAVGNFPTALRGYDRTAVDDYVRTLEEKALASRVVERELLPHFETGALTVPVAATFGLDEAEQAYDRFTSGGKLGKIVLLP